MNEYAIPIVLLVMVCVTVLRHVTPKAPTWLLPWVAVALAVGGSVVAAAMNADGIVTMRDVWTGVAEGLAACGLWSAGGRHVYEMLGLDDDDVKPRGGAAK